MSEQYSIGNRFDLAQELSFEPIGCYYRAVSLDGEEVLLLLLNSEASELARVELPHLQSEIIRDSELSSKNKKISGFLPILDICDFIEGIALVMPYVPGVTLADYLEKTKPNKLTKVKKSTKSALQALTSLHKNNDYHGFINFSTTWVDQYSNIWFIGPGILDRIFDGLNLFSTSLDLSNARISSFLQPEPGSQESTLDVIRCSKYSDYYAVYIIISSLLQGYLSSSGGVSSEAITNSVNSKSKVYLTPTFCNKFYREGVNIDEWISKLTPVASVTMLYPAASVAAISLVSVLAYNYSQFHVYNKSSQEIVTNTIDSFEGKKHNQKQDNKVTKSSTNNKDMSDTLNNIQATNHFTIEPLISSNKSASKTTQALQSPQSITSTVSTKTKVSPEYIAAGERIKDILNNLGIDNSKPGEQASSESKANKQIPAKIAFDLPELDIPELEIPGLERTNKDNQANQETITMTSNLLSDDIDPDSLKCKDNTCYDLISAGIRGPELSYLELGDDNTLVMKKPITRNDYYIYCYIEKSCSLKAQFDEIVMTKCLFANECSKSMSTWLKQPMEFISSYQVKKYINWLNNVTVSNYDVISDTTWIKAAATLNPIDNCKYNKTKNFIAYSSYPEWVKIGKTIAFRGPILNTVDKEQCKIVLHTPDAEKYLGKVYVRLVKHT